MLPATATVTMVTGWALIAVCFIFFGHAVDYILYFLHVHCDPSSIILRCVHLTDADADDEGGLWGVTLFCAALQAAAAVLALLLRSRRRLLRRGIECVALTVTVNGHYLYGKVVYLVIKADQGHVFYMVSRTAFLVVLAVGDVVSIITFVLGGGGHGEEEHVQAPAAEAAGGQGQQLPN